MLVVHADDRFQEHDMPPDHPECPERLVWIESALRDSPSVDRWLGASPGDPADVERVHDAGYVQAVRRCAETGGGALDPETIVSPRSYEAALGASGTLVAAARASLDAGADDPARRAFALVRPPGHHAQRDRGMGFCLFNHVAVAAAWARDVGGLERVAIVDFDVHHGNGTQQAFYEDGAVLYASVHRGRFYPATGAADETGAGPGRGTTVNVPLPASATQVRWREAVRRALDAVAAFQPELVLVSAGFDAYRHDPLGGLGLRQEDFQWVGENLYELARTTCGGRLVAGLEGGYAPDALGELAAAYAEGMAGDV